MSIISHRTQFEYLIKEDHRICLRSSQGEWTREMEISCHSHGFVHISIADLAAFLLYYRPIHFVTMNALNFSVSVWSIFFKAQRLVVDVDHKFKTETEVGHLIQSHSTRTACRIDFPFYLLSYALH